MGFKKKCVILIIILQTLPQIIQSAELKDPCVIPELSNDYNYDANGMQLVAGLYVYDGTTVSFNCKNNLMLYPAESIRTVCTDGSWTNEFPQCIMPKVLSRVRINDACIIPELSNNYNYNANGIELVAGLYAYDGTRVSFKCKNNLLLYPAKSTRTICSNGSWTNEFPQCRMPEPKIGSRFNYPCEIPELSDKYNYDANGIELVAGLYVPDGTRVSFKCKSYLHALYPPNYIRTVCIDGSWTNEFPQCLGTCPPRLSESVDTVCMRNGIKQDCSKRMVEGTQVTMKCKHLYIQNDNSINPVSVCRDNSWDSGFINCVSECGKLIPEGTTLVIGGENAVKGSFPWHVGIYRQETPDAKIKFKCGGSIISTRVVLSAAHCFASNSDGSKFDKNEFYIGAGKYFRDYDEAQDTLAQKSKVKDLIIPPHYKGSLSSYAGDVALVVLQTPFEITHVVQPVCVDWNNKYEDYQLRPRNQGSVVGWGQTVEGDNLSKELKQLNVPYIDLVECFKKVPLSFYPFLTPDKFCAGLTNGSSVCNGDSGGGLVFLRPEDNKYYIRGLVSVGPTKEYHCDSNQYGAYTKVSSYLKYLSEAETANRQ